MFMQNVGSGNGVDMGRKLKQMTDMGQNAMQNTLQVSRQTVSTRHVEFFVLRTLLLVTLLSCTAGPHLCCLARAFCMTWQGLQAFGIVVHWVQADA